MECKLGAHFARPSTEPALMVTIQSQQPTSSHRADVVVKGLPSHNQESTSNRGSARWVSSNGYDLDHSGRANLPAVLPILMGAGAPSGIFLDPQDSNLYENQKIIQSTFSGWFPKRLKEVPLDASICSVEYPQDRGVGCFFSGGVDSFYSAITRSQEITHLILVLGFDIPLTDDALCRKAQRDAERAAKVLGKKLIVMRTTIRRLSGRYAKWGIYHGPALATVGLLLAKHLKHVIIPSTYPMEDLHPWGSHPAIDHLWSTSYLNFEHHAQYKTRNQKIDHLSNYQVALDHLRVCWKNIDGQYNCGRCEKCLRTMIPLYAYGALEHCGSIPELNTDNLANFPFSKNDAHLAFAQKNLSLLKEMVAPDDPVRKALTVALT